MIIKSCAMEDARHLIAEQVASLSSPYDSFLEEHIRNSAFFLIQDGAEDVGYWAIHGGERLTQFYVRRSYQRHAQTLFLQALERHSVKSLFVPTGDELLVSMIMDHDLAIKKQAYFFQEGEMLLPSGEGDSFRPATEADLPGITEVCGDFLPDYERRMEEGELFVYRRDDELLGIGLVEHSHLIESTGSIGMFVGEPFRNQGIGKAIIVRLRQWCRERGITPVSGCWYYNEASKRTLERAGMVTKSRLLDVEAPERPKV